MKGGLLGLNCFNINYEYIITGASPSEKKVAKMAQKAERAKKVQEAETLKLAEARQAELDKSLEDKIEEAKHAKQTENKLMKHIKTIPPFFGTKTAEWDSWADKPNKKFEILWLMDYTKLTTNNALFKFVQTNLAINGICCK